jgi:N6-adenosine-specific RNA methylase IME4
MTHLDADLAAERSQPMWEGLSPPYATIVADPPWHYADRPLGWHKDRRRGAFPYSTMALEEIKALPVAELAKPEGWLFLWTTNRYLEAAFEVARAWNFKPSTTLVWCKPPHGEGPGGIFTITTEFIIVAQRIGPHSHARQRQTLLVGERIDRSWFEWPRGPHSIKPPAFLDLVELVSPMPRVELFARQPRLGWDSWGWGYEQAVTP